MLENVSEVIYYIMRLVMNNMRSTALLGCRAAPSIAVFIGGIDIHEEKIDDNAYDRADNSGFRGAAAQDKLRP